MRRVLLAAVMMMLASCACALELPDSVGEWQCVKEHVVPLVLDVNGESVGRMVYRDYEREGRRVQVILTEGKGTGSLYVPERVGESQGVMPSEAGYRLLKVAGRRAILEGQSFMPLALAVSVGDNVILTLEASSLTEDELVSLAEETLSSWSVTESDSYPGR